MNMTIKRTISLPLSRAWLPFVCVMLAFFSFVSLACAAQCGGVDCAQMTSKSAPMGNRSDHAQGVMVGSGCVLCYSVVAEQPVIAGVEPLKPLLYSTAHTQQSSYFTAPDPPPPRMIETF